MITVTDSAKMEKFVVPSQVEEHEYAAMQDAAFDVYRGRGEAF
jgi:hypothetical protein